MPELKSGVSANFTNGAKREGVTNLWKDSGVPSTRELFFFLLTTWNRTCWNTETTLSVCVLYTECCSSSVFSHTEPQASADVPVVSPPGCICYPYRVHIYLCLYVGFYCR